MTDQPSSLKSKVLLVTHDAEDLSILQRALKDFDLYTATDGVDALKLMERTNMDLIISEFRMPGVSGIELLHQTRIDHSDTKRMLRAPYSELTALIKVLQQKEAGLHNDDKLAAEVLAKPGEPAKILRVVKQVLGQTPVFQEPTEFSKKVLTWERAKDMLQWTAAKAARIRGVIIRPFPDDHSVTQIQLVIQQTERMARFRDSLPQRWEWPLKPRDQSLPSNHKKHPVVKKLGKIWGEQELFVQQVFEEDIYLYLLLLPWERENKTSLILGIHAETPDDKIFSALEEVHEYITMHVSRLVVPEAVTDEKTGEGPAYLPDYDWVIANEYVGPDRRDKPTSFLNQYVMIGKRLKIPQNMLIHTEAFVDRLERWVIYCFFAYLFLTTIDTVFTLLFVRAGVVQEANPVLRPLVEGYPWTFLLVKNLFSLTSFFVVARFQLSRVGKVLLPFNIIFYLSVVIYWFVLLFRHYFTG